MRKKILFPIILILMTCTAGTVSAQNQGDVSVEFEGLYWFSELRANALLNNQIGTGTEFNLEADLGLGDKDIPSGRFTWYTGPRSRLFFDYSEARFNGQTILGRPIVLGDTTFFVGASASVDLKMSFATLGWIWQFIDVGDGAFKLGTLLEARGAFTDLIVTGAATGIGITSTERTIDAGLPTLGLALDINPAEWMNIFVRAAGMTVDRYGYFSDGEAGIKLFPVRNLSISGGYRYEAIEADHPENDSFIRLTFKGPYAGASLRF